MRAIVDELYRRIAAILEMPNVKRQIDAMGLEIVASSLAEFTACIDSELKKWGKLIEDAKVTVDRVARRIDPNAPEENRCRAGKGDSRPIDAAAQRRGGSGLQGLLRRPHPPAVQVAYKWDNGKWTYEVARKLKTGSKFDIQFEPGKTHYFGFAAFDNAQVRHAMGSDVLKLVFAP